MRAVVVAQSLAELVAHVECFGQGRVEHRGRLLMADREGIRLRFQMADGLEGSIGAPWPVDALRTEDGRAQLLRTVNSLIQRCGMFEVCERAYQLGYGKRTA
jgi:hypothetical protein